MGAKCTGHGLSLRDITPSRQDVINRKGGWRGQSHMIVLLRRMVRAAGGACLLAALTGSLLCLCVSAMATGCGVVLGSATRAASVLSVAFSGDGKRIAAVGKGTPFCVWDIATGRRVAEISSGRQNPLSWSLALSPHGKLLAAGTKPPFLRSILVPSPSRLVHFDDVSIWRVRTGNLYRRFSDFQLEDPHPTFGLAFSPDGQYVAAGKTFGTPRAHLKIWDVATGKLARGLVRNAITVASPQFSPLGGIAAQPIGSGALVRPGSPLSLWDIATGRVIQTYKGCGPVVLLAFSPDGRMLAGARGREVCLWEARTGARSITLRANHGPLVALAFNGQSALAWAVARDSAYLWDLNEGQQVRRCGLPALRMPAQFSPNGKLLAWGDPRSRTVHLWDAAGCKEIRQFALSASR